MKGGRGAWRNPDDFDAAIVPQIGSIRRLRRRRAPRYRPRPESGNIGRMRVRAARDPPPESDFVTELTRWAFPPALQPTQGEVAFDLKSALDGVVALRAEIPDDAFTASILGTDRTGNGVVIRDDGLVLTIGYLITEAAIGLAHATRRLGRARAIRSPTISRRASVSSCRWAGSTLPDDRARVRDVGRGGRRRLRDRPWRTRARAEGHALRQARIRRILGISPRRRAVHDAAASGMERRGAARRRWPAHRHRLAAAAGESRRRDRRRQHVRARRPARADPRRSRCAPDARRSRRGRGSACTRPIATAASWSTDSRAAARRSAPACTPAISSSPSAASASRASPTSSARSGGRARPAPRFR